MADRLFWRVLGVFLVVGLFAVACGLCRISPLPSPSFASLAYADVAPPTPAAPTPTPKSFKVTIENEEGNITSIVGVEEITVAGQKLMISYSSEIFAIDDKDKLSFTKSGRITLHANPNALNRAMPENPKNATPATLPPSATPPAETKEPASKPADSPSESSKKSKTAKIVLETKEGERYEVTAYELLDETSVAELKKILDRNPSSRLGPPRNLPVPVTYDTIASARYSIPPLPPTSSSYVPNRIYTAASYPAPVPPAAPPYLHTAPPSNLPKLEFQKLNSEVFFGRAKVPGGWLISTPTNVTFYPDPEHKWNGGSID